MRQISKTVAALSVGLALLLPHTAQSQEKVVIGMPAWPSAEARGCSGSCPPARAASDEGGTHTHTWKGLRTP